MVCIESQNMFQVEQWSTLNKAYRVIAWVLRFIAKIRKVDVPFGDLTSNELKNAKQYFLKILQLQNFQQEIMSLKTKKPYHGFKK